jgi:hypothetical protein
MDLLEASSIDTNTIWKAAGKPLQGPIFEKRSSQQKYFRLVTGDKHGFVIDLRKSLVALHANSCLSCQLLWKRQENSCMVNF